MAEIDAVSGMMTFTDLTSVPSDPPAPFTGQLLLAVAAYLARFKGCSREHTESDLRCYLSWCAEREDVPAFVELESGGPPPVACRVVGVGQSPNHPT